MIDETQMNDEVCAEFRVHKLNEDGMKKAEDLATVFNTALSLALTACPEGRERSLVKTHMELACFYAKKSMAQQKENQQ